jgi:hypothetical protein
MNRRQNRFSGNILLYDYLSAKRARILLRRNLDRALRVHRHLSENIDLQDFSRDSHKLRSVWEPPTWDALDEMVDRAKSKGSFILEVHAIKAAQCKPPTERNEPAKKTRILLRTKSIMHATVISTLSNLPCFSMPGQSATLQGIARGAVIVDTERFIINPKSLIGNGLQFGTKDAYKLNISINIDTRNNAEELYNHLGVSPASPGNMSTRFSTTCDNIWKCPKNKVVLALRDSKGSLDLGLGLEVRMYWNSDDDGSILTTYNRHLRSQKQMDSSLVSPSALQLRDATPKLVFVYDEKTITRHGLVCPHSGCETWKGSDISAVHVHLHTWHGYLEYEKKLNTDEDGQETWTFTCEVSDHRADRADHRASANADEPLDVRMQAPSEPFNASRDPSGDDYRRKAKVDKQYTAGRAAVTVPIDASNIRRKLPEHVAEMPPRKKKRYAVPEAPSGITFFRSFSKRPLATGEYISESDDEVDDSWLELRRIAEFDKDHNLPQSAKRFLKAFDTHMWREFVQSDIHAGESLVRFVQRKCEWIWTEDVFNTFRDKIDEMLEDLIITKEVHASCLKIVEAAKPTQAEEAQEISQRLANLEVRQMSHDSLCDGPHTTCTRRSRERASHAISRGKPSDKATSKGKGKARVTETGHLTPVTADSDGDLEMREANLSTETVRVDHDHNPGDTLPYDLCLCGEDALVSSRTSPLLACSSMVRESNEQIETVNADCTRTVHDATSTMIASKTGGKSRKLRAI